MSWRHGHRVVDSWLRRQDRWDSCFRRHLLQILSGNRLATKAFHRQATMVDLPTQTELLQSRDILFELLIKNIQLIFSIIQNGL